MLASKDIEKLNNSDRLKNRYNFRVKPSVCLNDIVESIWIQHQDEIPEHRAVSKVVPTGTVEILFHYGDLISHVHPGGAELMPRSYVTGQRKRPVYVLGTGRAQVVIVSLYPWGLKSLFPQVSDLTDGYVDLKFLANPAEVTCLEEQLACATGSQERIQLVQQYLLQNRKGQTNTRMIAASKLLSTQGLNKSIAAVTQALGVSERHLARQFKSEIGVQPSVFLRIMRFQNAIRARRTSGLSWACIAADCGFSDQSHLVREIREFSGTTPGSIDLDSGAGPAVFNGPDVSEFFDTVYL